MVNYASRADYENIARWSEEYSLEYPVARDWSRSPFNWLLSVPPATRGAIGRRMVADWAASLGLATERVRDGFQQYVLVNGHRLQVKLSTLWQSGEYRFQQIRDHNYEQLLCLGISPDDVHAWLIPKPEAFLRLPGQHTGQGAVETRWLHTDPGGSERWLSDYGNQLSDVASLLRAL